jgi:hypothetical protein
MPPPSLVVVWWRMPSMTSVLHDAESDDEWPCGAGANLNGISILVQCGEYRVGADAADVTRFWFRVFRV